MHVDHEWGELALGEPACIRSHKNIRYIKYVMYRDMDT